MKTVSTFTCMRHTLARRSGVQLSLSRGKDTEVAHVPLTIHRKQALSAERLAQLAQKKGRRPFGQFHFDSYQLVAINAGEDEHAGRYRKLIHAPSWSKYRKSARKSSLSRMPNKFSTLLLCPALFALCTLHSHSSAFALRTIKSDVINCRITPTRGEGAAQHEPPLGARFANETI